MELECSSNVRVGNNRNVRTYDLDQYPTNPKITLTIRAKVIQVVEAIAPMLAVCLHKGKGGIGDIELENMNEQ